MKVDTPDSASTISMTNTITITVEQDGIYEVNGARQDPVINLQMVTGSSKLRKQLRDSDELIICPGVYDGLSARIAINMGFKAMYMVCPPSPHALLLPYLHGISPDPKLTIIDRSRHYCVPTGPCRSRTGSSVRYAHQRRDDCESGPLRPAVDC